MIETKQLEQGVPSAAHALNLTWACTWRSVLSAKEKVLRCWLGRVGQRVMVETRRSGELRRREGRGGKRRKKRRVLQQNATHCNTLQYTATHCNTLQRISNAFKKSLCCEFHAHLMYMK